MAINFNLKWNTYTVGYHSPVPTYKMLRNIFFCGTLFFFNVICQVIYLQNFHACQAGKQKLSSDIYSIMQNSYSFDTLP